MAVLEIECTPSPAGHGLLPGVVYKGGLDHCGLPLNYRAAHHERWKLWPRESNPSLLYLSFFHCDTLISGPFSWPPLPFRLYAGRLCIETQAPSLSCQLMGAGTHMRIPSPHSHFHGLHRKLPNGQLGSPSGVGPWCQRLRAMLA